MFDEMAKMVHAHHTTLNLKLQPNIQQISGVECETVMFKKETETLIFKVSRIMFVNLEP